MRFIAVFIDWENIEKTIKEEFGSILNYEQFISIIKNESKKIGEIVGIFAYGDFDKGEAGIQTKLINLGVQPKHVVTKTPFEYLKGSTDIELSLDILDNMYSYPHITDFLFISGDGDLKHVARRLKINGKYIHLMGFESRTSKNMIEFSNTFIDLNDYPLIMRKITKTEKERIAMTLYKDEHVKVVLQHLNYLETVKEFVGLNYLRKKLIEKNPETLISDALTKCIDFELIDTYQVENPNDIKNPTTACRLNRANSMVKELIEL